MADSFTDLLLKLREAHEREVEGWQVKVQELSNKKGCDTKRMEELFTRNQQMKEQQRILTENMKTLENRLRAGLCDRCTVTQDVAKRRQQEYEATQIQSLQRISLLAGELNSLKTENKRLREDIRSLRAAVEGHSDHSSSSSTATDVKANSSPDLSPSSGPVALISLGTGRASNQPADGDAAVKIEAEPKTEDNRHENRHLREWHKTVFETYKPPSASASASTSWKTQDSMPRVVERSCRTQSIEGQDRQISNSSPLKSSPLSSASREVNSRPVHVHTPVPCRPHPVKTTPWSLSESPDWTAVGAGTNLLGQYSARPNPLRFQNIPFIQQASYSNPRRAGLVLGAPWSKQSTLQASSKEPTVVLSLRSLSEQTERPCRPQEKKDVPPLKNERVSGEGNKDVCEGPLDLSDPGRSKSSQREDSPSALQVTERVEESTEGDGKENSAANNPASSSSPASHSLSVSTSPLRQSEESSNDHNHKLVIKLLKPKEEMNGKTDQNNGKKVPVQTISLRPVVVLESLNFALQKQESSSSIYTTPSPEGPESSSEEKDEEGSASGQESTQGSKRKRASVETETDRDSDADNFQQERKIKITLRSDRKSPS
ncbi:uncharacterized protein rbbp8l isoform X3 [Sphaeramia orbicularis]|uniref:uncharacterized protein rbbp8l isoform X3 n=1 Tax=Sphaeramia orbicularis TaxID=375764 RepID=UPI00117D69D6|nr:RBBP8 N-terminal-like protein isoform X3 [Sphaeramia orbicularis]